MCFHIFGSGSTGSYGKYMFKETVKLFSKMSILSYILISNITKSPVVNSIVISGEVLASHRGFILYFCNN